MNEHKWFGELKQVAKHPERHETVEDGLRAEYYQEIISEQSRQITHAFDDFETDRVFDHLISELHDSIITLEADLPSPLSPLSERSLNELYTLLTSKINKLKTSLDIEKYKALQSLAHSLFETTMKSPQNYNPHTTEGMDQASLEDANYEHVAFEEFAERMKVVVNQINMSFDEYQALSARQPEATLLRHIRRICESIAYEWQRLPHENSTHTSEARNKAYPHYQQTINYLGKQIHMLEQRADVSYETLEQLKQLFEQAYQAPAWLSQDDPDSPNKED